MLDFTRRLLCKIAPIAIFGGYAVWSMATLCKQQERIEYLSNFIELHLLKEATSENDSDGDISFEITEEQK